MISKGLLKRTARHDPTQKPKRIKEITLTRRIGADDERERTQL
jgi:hypothetical protein